jgi:alpha-mannosidase
MNPSVTRRRFLRLGLAGTTAAIFGPSQRLCALAAGESFCVTLCNHWSYTGIGWQLGIESSVLSVTDAMEMADREPHVKTCINLDARAYEVMAQDFPEVAEKLKQYLAEGKVELIGGTYGQPMGTTFSGESNIRQLVYGREAIRKALGYEMATFLEEEEFSHPQVPQIALGAGYRYASLAQVDTWGNAGIPRLEVNVLNWKGMDGTIIPSTPKNSLFGYSPDLKQLATSDGFKKLQKLGKPLVFTWEEFGWEPPEDPAYLTTPEKYRKFAAESPVEFVTLREYVDKYGAQAKESVYFNMDAWHKLLTWGLGGDQLRILDRKVEALLHAAERFDAVAGTLGAPSQARNLENAWKHLLVSQSHDVGLCEYSRWQGDRMAPLDRVEDYHNLTWGAIGYNHLDAAQSQAQSVLDSSTSYIARRIGAAPGEHGQMTVSVFNPCSWERSDVALTGRVYPVPGSAKDVIVRDRSDRVVPSQIIKSDRDPAGNLVMANVAFLASGISGLGYGSYYLEFARETAAPAAALRVNEQQLELENEFVKVRLGAAHGAIVSLFDKRSGQEMLNGKKSPFPVFKGSANRDYALRSMFVRMKYGDPQLAVPEFFDSSEAVSPADHGTPSSAPSDWRAPVKSEIRWIEKGPLRATVKASHQWPLLKFETYVSLCAGSPRVEVTSRVLSELPPKVDVVKEGRFPLEIKEGYWLTFAPAFEVASVVRDFPLGIESTERQDFQALTFVDLVGRNASLLLVHPGTQYFKHDGQGVFSNLLMREWESHWTGEYGWPRYAEYRHALQPHGSDFSNAARLRAAAEFDHKLITVLGQPSSGNLPAFQGFLKVTPEDAHLLAFRRKEDGLEIRLTETAGRRSEGSLELAFPVNAASETDLLGRKTAEAPRNGNTLRLELQPWKVQTLSVT